MPIWTWMNSENHHGPLLLTSKCWQIRKKIVTLSDNLPWFAFNSKPGNCSAPEQIVQNFPPQEDGEQHSSISPLPFLTCAGGLAKKGPCRGLLQVDRRPKNDSLGDNPKTSHHIWACLCHSKKCARIHHPDWSLSSRTLWLPSCLPLPPWVPSLQLLFFRFISHIISPIPFVSH